MALGRVKTWIAEVLTASDLNAEFNNILNNALSLISPLTGTLDADGKEIVLDADGDTSITADTDDRLDVKLSGTDLFRFDGTATTPVNGFDFVAAAASSEPSITAAGSDTDISITLTPKGAGTVDLSTAAINEVEGAAVASAATADIWATDGNTVHVTGTTTITSLGTAPNAGASRWIIFDGALTLTHAANLNLPGSANITTAAGDFARVYADTTTQLDLQYFKADGTAVVATEITLGTEQASTSGTAIDFTGIASGANRITVLFEGVSTSGTSDYLIQIGDSGGFETTGYVSQAEGVNTASAGNSSTAGFIIVAGLLAADVYKGTVTLTRMNASHKWVSIATISDNAGAGAEVWVSSGTKTLSAELTQIRITTAGGSDTFDAGNINTTVE